MLKINEIAPNFTLLDQNNKSFTLSDFRNQKVLLYFYPKDNTPGCTNQACSYRDNIEEFNKLNIKVVGISTDSVDSHNKFIDKNKLNFTLLSDSNKEVVQKYFVWREKVNFGKKYFGIIRSTFLVDEDGKLIYVKYKTSPSIDVENVLKILQKWK
ncbi:thioredoxin-dependent thiol peroxidase [Mycoplasmopsis anatis]|uniref:thioredoxin-dependent peroxiredoxin n=1 Tax=Mycoplasmopsis anatis TaxID=171279 RepID=A0A9Q3L8U7_9BACT|nr:thioredoxin-dependent thiol peroxidase [Mycoplasmopsis anatis]MBW0594939.1 thioredoxin-dependent thiol peroxidase [Mycoplasmopsis anatis]MBW0595558.1 thioredoxin-dependent thiol peroxidase [Mycoplasmopsis anatis]MBW0595819.1 thioredoxin-dependent thiol peroxidase [Mycoplasmopsis anatis]MBW0596723.1 thioredoxin-dependent thiol peroxidase [Mycoplasmopsis anatis]MBW0598540.1 thioredoxin-dependent thiol peroxidase [Mycoplasmopsis anatis]